MFTAKELDALKAEIKKNPVSTSYRKADGNALYIQVKKSTISWHMNCRYNGKQQTLSFGTYPKTSIKEAREKCHKAHVMLDNGEDPRPSKRKNIKSFEDVYNEWFKIHYKKCADSTIVRELGRFNNHIKSEIGSKNISEVRVDDVTNIAQKIHAKDTRDTANRVLDIIHRVIRYARIKG